MESLNDWLIENGLVMPPEIVKMFNDMVESELRKEIDQIEKEMGIDNKTIINGNLNAVDSFPGIGKGKQVNTDEMQAGREMDALIETRLFNKKFHRTFTPAYSTDIADAWQVVEKIVSIGFSLHYHSSEKRPFYSVISGRDDNTIYTQADTAPLAICRAALKVMELA